MAVRFYFDAPLARWAFVRGNEQMVMDHVATGAIVLAFSGAAPQVMRFDNPTDAVFFQCNIETELERTGWMLAVFESSVAEGRQGMPLTRRRDDIRG